VTDHGWPDHHDDGDPALHDASWIEDPPDVHVPFEDHPVEFDDQHPHWAEPDHPPPVDDVTDHQSADDQSADDHTPDAADTTHDSVPADPDPETVFPPAVDVGPLPEPVDGFPWIDTGSLGVVDPEAAQPAVDPVDPHELAAYAGTELPPGADPWATLAGSDDPATAALARWWAENQR
jgi:hypothetical protein